MRFYWIFPIIATLLSMGLLVVILGQYQELERLKMMTKQLKKTSERLYIQYLNEDLYKVSVEKLVDQGQKGAEGLEAEVAKLSPEVEKKKTENEACQAEVKTRADELDQTQKEYTETKGTLDAETETWNQEINALKAQLTALSPVCAHVKKDALALKLCGNHTN